MCVGRVRFMDQIRSGRASNEKKLQCIDGSVQVLMRRNPFCLKFRDIRFVVNHNMRYQLVINIRHLTSGENKTIRLGKSFKSRNRRINNGKTSKIQKKANLQSHVRSTFLHEIMEQRRQWFKAIVDLVTCS